MAKKTKPIVDKKAAALELIKKGLELGDEKLQKMGEQMLEEAITHLVPELAPAPEPESKKEDSFIASTRPGGVAEQSRVRYNDAGDVDGMYTRKEAISVTSNQFEDDRTIPTDKQNEALKSVTVHTPRNRPAPKKIPVTCHMCNRTEHVHAIHKGGELYKCSRCITRGVRR